MGLILFCLSANPERFTVLTPYLKADWELKNTLWPTQTPLNLPPLDLLIVDLSTEEQRDIWTDFKKNLSPIKPCIGFFNPEEEALAYQYLDRGQIQDYGLGFECGLYPFRKMVRHALDKHQNHMMHLTEASEAKWPDDFEENNSIIQEIVNLIPTPIFVKNQRHQWVLFNQAFANMLGHTQEELLGKSDYDFFPKEEADIFWAKDQEVFNSEEPNINEETVTDKSGQTQTIMTKKVVFADQQGQKFLIGSIANIDHLKKFQTEIQALTDELEVRVIERTRELESEIENRKQIETALRTKEQKLLSFTQALPDPCFVFDEAGHYIEVYAHDESLLLLPKEQLIGKKITETLPSPLAEQGMEMVTKTFQSGLSQTLEYTLEVPDGLKWFEGRSILFHNDSVGQNQVIFMIRDITQRKAMQKAQLESERKFRAIFNQTHHMMAIIDLQGRIVDINQMTLDVLGVSPENLVGRKLYDTLFWHQASESNSPLKQAIDQAIEGHKQAFEIIQTDIHGHELILDASITPVKDDTGTIRYLVAAGHNITHLRTTLEKLKKSEMRFQHLTDSLDDIVYTLDDKLSVQNIFGPWYESFSLKPEDLLHQQFESLLFKSKSFHLAQHQKVLEGQPVAYEWDIHPQNHPLYFQSKLTPLRNEENAIIGVVGVIRDISYLKHAEHQIKSSLEEKEILLREIYHRVKNNLQVISSLLNLQARKTPHSETVNILKETQNRVLAMALVHEKLYESKDLTQINFGDYLQDLCSQISYAYGLGLSKREIRFRCDPIYLSIDIGIAAGLILNELVSNALKHAFIFTEFDIPPDTQWIDIELSSISEQECLIMISDNGRGLPPHIDFHNPDTLGLRLVKNLITQINGEIEVKSEKGTQYKLHFPIALTD